MPSRELERHCLEIKENMNDSSLKSCIKSQHKIQLPALLEICKGERARDLSSGEANLKADTFSQANISPTVQQRSVIFFIKISTTMEWQVRTRKKKKGHGWGAAGKRTKESDGTYLSHFRF
jgi:hypothetical protein